jgi:uncharacterized membrane protein (DUF485 family)
MATNAPLGSDRGASPRYSDGVRASRIPVEPGPQALARRRAKRTAVLLGLVAASFYIGFIILTYFRSQH